MHRLQPSAPIQLCSHCLHASDHLRCAHSQAHHNPVPLQRQSLLRDLQDRWQAAGCWWGEWLCPGERPTLQRPPTINLLERCSSSECTAGFDGLVSKNRACVTQVFDPKSQTLLRQLKGHERPVHTTRFSPSKMHVLSGSDDATVRPPEPHANSQCDAMQCTLVAHGEPADILSLRFPASDYAYVVSITSSCA